MPLDAFLLGALAGAVGYDAARWLVAAARRPRLVPRRRSLVDALDALTAQEAESRRRRSRALRGQRPAERHRRPS